MRTRMSLGLLAVLSLVVLDGCGKPDVAATAKCKGETSDKNRCNECCKRNGDWGHTFVVGVECQCEK